MSVNRKNILVGGGTLEVDSTDVGYTEEGVTMSVEREYIDIEADQSIGTIGKRKIRERCFISTTMQEATLDNLRIAFDLPSGSSDVLSFGGDDTVTERELEFTGTGPDGADRVFTVYKAVSIEPGEHTYQRGEKTLIPVRFEAIEDTTKPQGKRYGKIEDS